MNAQLIPPHTMTIDDAQKIYRDYGDELEDFYSTIYKKLIADKPRVELANNNYLHALQLSSLMIRNTHKSFEMLSGGTTDNFIQMLRNEFRGMLVRLVSAKGKAKIIILNAVSNGANKLEELQKEFPNTLEVSYGIAKEPNKISHFIVADSMVRIENPHGQLSGDTNANTVEAKVIFNSGIEAEAYRKNFDFYWKRVNLATASS